MPSRFSAVLWLSPAAIAMTLLRLTTLTGTVRFTVDPSPNSPSVLPPQAQTVPSFFSASPWSAPDAIAMILLSVKIVAGR